MEHLPQTKGKGVLMFARRRQRTDEIAAEHEELRSKGIPVEAFMEPETEGYLKPQEDILPVRQQPKYQDHQAELQTNTGINGLDSHQESSASKPLVSNRTAKPFLSGLQQSQNVSSATTKISENIFIVPVPVNTAPQVWSPTGDIIASRDERIAVPAIKSVILPEMKRRGKNKSKSKEPPEEDYFSLGAEACNFMQTPNIRQKHPPPVLPKPSINPQCPPWSSQDNTVHSPFTPSSPLPAQQNWPPPHPPHHQPATKPWVPSPSQPQQHATDYLPAKSSASYKPTWSSEPQQKVTAAAPFQPMVPSIKPQSASSVISCPPQRARSYVRPSKAPQVSSISEIGSSGGIFKGKGAELFARRQSRMEKFIVDDETVQANITRSPSPTMSMPSTWKYSSNVRAPPPVSYNPIVSPFYPPAAQKQSLTETSSTLKAKDKQETPKTAPKTLSVMEVLKHRPYQLDSSLFSYSSNTEAKGLSPTPPAEAKQSQGCSPTYLHASSPVPSAGIGQFFQQVSVGNPGVSVSVPYPFTRQSTPAETFPSAAPAPAPAPCTMPPGPVYSRSRSMSLPRRRSSMSTMSPVSSPGFYPILGLVDRQMSWAEAPRKPLVLVTEEENLQNPKSSGFQSTVHRRSLSEDKPAVCGPPFRPAQILPLGSRYSTTCSLPRNFSPQSEFPQSHRVSWRM